MRFKIFSFVLFLMLFVSCQVTIKETVITPKSSDALLSKLEIYTGEKLLDINFSSTRYEYVYFLQEDGTNSEVSLKYEKSDSNSKVYANSDSLMLERNSSNYFNITVISEDAKVTNIYKVNIFYYDLKSSAMLKEFSVNEQSADDFAPDYYSYKINLTGDSFIPKFHAISDEAIVTCVDSNGTEYFSGTSCSWVDKTNLTFTVTVTLNETKSVYTFELNKIKTDVVSNIFYNFSDLSAQFASDGYTTVIAGDSLSVGYGFFGKGFTNAWDNYSGILSWSHMVRDAIHRNDSGFYYADNLLDNGKIERSDSIKFTRWWSDGRKDATSSYWMPFNNRNVYFYNISATDEVSFFVNNSNATTNKAVLYFARNPGDTACSFKVKLNGKEVKVKVSDQTCRSLEVDTVDLTGNKAFTGDDSYLAKTYKSNFYAGRELVVVEISNLSTGENRVTLNSFTNTKGKTDCGFFILGCGTKYSPVYLNGRSNATSDFYIDTSVENGAFNQRLCVPVGEDRLPPDCLIWIIGANDSVNGRGTGNNGSNDKGVNKGTVAVEQYKKNLNTVLATLREKNPKMQIILLSSPVWGTKASNDDPNYETRRNLLLQYAGAMESVAENYGAMFLNNVHLFDSLPVNEASDTGAAVYWRATNDTIHFSRFGHTVLAKNLLSKLMPLGLYPKEMIDAEKIYCEGINY